MPELRRRRGDSGGRGASVADEAVPRVVRVFVSSTFRDMQAERDELAKQTFPALRKLCESREVTWGDVDLRWGITDEQKAEGEVLPTCLAEIGGCRPFFIGILGERYGWVPDAIEPLALEREPWLADHADRSVTELEILHGVLNDPDAADHTFFYLRDPAYVKGKPVEQFGETPAPEEVLNFGQVEADRRAANRSAKLAELKARVRSSGLPVREDYADPRALGALVLADLTALIESLFPDGSAPGALTREATEHEAFARSRARVYIGRKAYSDRLDAHARGEGSALVVIGASGSGKSALLANWALGYRAAHPDVFVLPCFVGASPAGTDWAGMVRRIIGELSRRFDLKVEIPDPSQELRATFATTLHRAAAKGRVVLVIDAVNQLEDREGALDLSWVPPAVPDGIRLVVSTLPGRPLDEAIQRGWPTLAVEPLEPTERAALIVAYLKSYSRALGSTLVTRVSEAPQCANPLYLRALLDELRMWGEHETLGKQIDHYLKAKSIGALYELILARYEQDYERDRPHLVRDAFTGLWAARRGLSETELLDLLGTDANPLPRAHWSPLFLASESSLTNRSGLLTFFHDYLRQAVETRYLPTDDDKHAAHLRLADYFTPRDTNPRTIDELWWQLAESQEWRRLFDLLANAEYLEPAWTAARLEVRTAWARVEANSALRLVDAYASVIDAPEKQGVSFAAILSSLLTETSHPEQALSLNERLIRLFRSTDDKRNLSAALLNRGGILDRGGNLDGALALYTEAEQLCRETGDQGGLARALTNQSSILHQRGNLPGAMALLTEVERILRTQSDRAGLNTTLGNRANILKALGDPDGAMVLLREVEAGCRELGDQDGLQFSLSSQGDVLYLMGDLSGAMDRYREAEWLCREIGDPAGLQDSHYAQANILYDRGGLDGAMDLLKEQERICREIWHAAGLRRSLGGQALILRARGELDGAMALRQEEARLSREQSNLGALSVSLSNQALILKERGDFEGSLVLMKQEETICRELRTPEGLAVSLINQASLLGSLMDRPREALPLAEEAFRLANECHLGGLAARIVPLLNLLRTGG